MPYVASVNDVKCQLYGSPDGDVVLVDAQGEVPTSGWTSPRLNARYYVTPPQDGVQEFDFSADPPHGFVLQAFFPIAATTTFPAPAWLKGVRVIAETNDRESPVAATKAVAVPAPSDGRVGSGRRARRRRARWSSTASSPTTTASSPPGTSAGKALRRISSSRS